MIVILALLAFIHGMYARKKLLWFLLQYYHIDLSVYISWQNRSEKFNFDPANITCINLEINTILWGLYHYDTKMQTSCSMFDFTKECTPLYHYCLNTHVRTLHYITKRSTGSFFSFFLKIIFIIKFKTHHYISFFYQSCGTSWTENYDKYTTLVLVYRKTIFWQANNIMIIGQFSFCSVLKACTHISRRENLHLILVWGLAPSNTCRGLYLTWLLNCNVIHTLHKYVYVSHTNKHTHTIWI